MRAGRLDRRVTIQAATETRDSFGQPVPTWADLAAVAAEKVSISPRERFAGQQTLAEETTVFRVRWRSDVTAKMRLVHDGKTYRIEGVAEVGRRVGLDLFCVAVVP